MELEEREEGKKALFGVGARRTDKTTMEEKRRRRKEKGGSRLCNELVSAREMNSTLLFRLQAVADSSSSFVKLF